MADKIEYVSLYMGGPLVAKDSPLAKQAAAAAKGGTVSEDLRRHIADATERAHRAADGSGEYGNRGLKPGQGWRRFDNA
jgi:hypothetical protein